MAIRIKLPYLQSPQDNDNWSMKLVILSALRGSLMKGKSPFIFLKNKSMYDMITLWFQRKKNANSENQVDILSVQEKTH